jgi:glycosyltransferase involved in cell wall biosynthesis
MDAPTVSIVIAAFNADAYVAQAVESALSQKNVPLEVIVVDDGSTDGTRAALEAFGHRIRCESQAHFGVSAARNRGLASSRGEFVAFLDADDWYMPGKLADQVGLLRQNSKLGAAHSGWTLVNEAAEPIETVTPWTMAPKLNLETWLMWKPVFLGAMLFRRDWLLRVPPFDPDLQRSEDLDLILRLSAAGCRMAWIRRPTVCYRQTPTSLTRDTPALAMSLMSVLDRFFGRTPLPKRARRIERKVRYFSLMWVVGILWEAGQLEAVADYLAESRRWSDLSPEYAACDWFGRLVRWTSPRSRAARPIHEAYPLFQQALGLEDSAWAPLRDKLDWLDGVWNEYLAGNRTAAFESLQRYGRRTARGLVKAAHAGLLSGAATCSTEVVDRFCADIMQLGWVSPPERSETGTLYLTVFAQSVFHRRWREAMAAFRRAVQVAATWRAAGVWYRFFRAALEYYLRPARRNRQTYSRATAERS